MITAVDTNVLVALLAGTDQEARAARRSLIEAHKRGTLVVSAPVYAELVAAPGHGVEAVDAFLSHVRIGVDWLLSERVWHTAALAYRGYAERRRSQPENSGPRCVLADFVIGAHALLSASALLTLDQRTYRAAFPELEVLTCSRVPHRVYRRFTETAVRRPLA